MSKLLNYKGLYGENQFSVIPEFINHEALETRSSRYNWEIKEHIHTDLIQVFIIESGEGSLISGNREIPFKNPSIILIPTNTIHGFTYNPKIKGDVFTISDNYFESLFKESPQIIIELNYLNQLDFSKNDVFFQQILEVKNIIVRELIEGIIEKRTVLKYLFQLFFTYLYRHSISSKNQVSESDNRTLNYYKSFQKSIKTSKNESKSIKEYAAELNITSTHLNRICQALVQQSAQQIIHDFLIAESKKYLLNTNYSVSEISYLLNFREPAYFTRFFKQRVGIPPKEFRNK